MATSNHTKFDTLRIKKKKTLVTQRQNGGEDSFLGTADKAPERHSVAMPMQEDSKLRSLQSTWLTAQPDPKKTKLLYPTLMRVMKDFPGQCSPEQLQNYIAKVWMMPQMALQDTKTRYKTDLKKGTLTPKYDKEFQIPAKTEDLKKDGTCLALAVYHTDAKHIAGLCLLPCQDIPVLRVQESCASKEWVLPLFLVQDTSSLPLRELLVRQAAHDPEATKLYKYLNKKLHVTFRSSPS
eukprot:Em0020g909a